MQNQSNGGKIIFSKNDAWAVGNLQKREGETLGVTFKHKLNQRSSTLILNPKIQNL